MKKQLLFLLTALLCGVCSYAADGDTFSYKGLKYKVTSETEKEVEVSGYEGTPVELTIPSTAQSTSGTYTVTRIGDNAFNSCESITTVTMANTITEIGFIAFSNCRNLTEVSFSQSLIRIEGSAFAVCWALENVEFPETLKELERWAFGNCKFKSVTLPKSLELFDSECFDLTPLENIYVDSENPIFCDVDGVMYSKNKTKLILYPCARTEFNIINTVSIIGDKACERLSAKNVAIPNSVIEIGAYAFFNSNGMITLSLPNSLEKIEIYAFEYCHNLQNISTIPESISIIGTGALSGCSSLKNIKVDSNNKKYCDIDGVLYSKDRKTLHTVPGGREEYIFPSSVTDIRDYAFVDCKIKTIEVPEGISSIPWGCFEECSSLESVSLSKTITSINAHAFDLCNELSTVYSYNPNPPVAYMSSFNDYCNKDAIIYVPKGSKAKYAAAEGWNYFHDFREMEGTEPELPKEPEVAMIEYFIDKDPGFGRGTQFKTSALENVIAIPTGTVNPGAHLLSVRACDAEGNWSATVSNPLYVLEPMGLKDAEYFVDHDPGKGHATKVTVNQDGSIAFSVSTAGLSTGIHELTLRGLMPNGEWLTLFENPFVVTELNGVNDIAWTDDINISRQGSEVKVSGKELAAGKCIVEIYDLRGALLLRDSTDGISEELTYTVDHTSGPVIVRVVTPTSRRSKIVR